MELLLELCVDVAATKFTRYGLPQRGSGRANQSTDQSISCQSINGDTLRDLKVPIWHVPIEKPRSDLYQEPLP